MQGGIREAGSVLDAEAQIQSERQAKFIKEQAEAGNESYARLQEIMQDKQFQAMSDAEKKTTLEANGLYDEFQKSQKETRDNICQQFLTIGRTFAGFAKGRAQTNVEGIRGKLTAQWEKKALGGMKNMTGDDVKRLHSSDEYNKAIADGKNEKQAMQEAFLAEKREEGKATGMLGSNGMVSLPHDMIRGLGKRKTDDQYRKTFSYAQRKAELMKGGMSAEDADLKAIEEQNKMYDASRELRLKQSKGYKETFKKQLAEGKSLKQAEEEGLRAARENEANTKSITEVMKEKFGSVKAWWDRFTGKDSASPPPLPDKGAGAPSVPPDTSSEKEEHAEDAIIQKNGKVIHLSDEDNVYATKNEPHVLRDREAQMAMPNVPHIPAEFSDAGIIAKLQELIDALNKKNMSVNVAAPTHDVNFDDFRMAAGL